MSIYEPLSRIDVRPSTAENAFAWFQRLIAAYCLLWGVLYWIRLVGLYEGPLARFDLMPVHWQVASVTLAVFFPFAAIGLWMLASWGPVIWLICAATETAMYLGFSGQFGFRPAVVATHAAVGVIYLAFIILISRQRRLQEVSRH